MSTTQAQHTPGEWASETAMSSDVHHVRYITADGKIIASVRHRIEQSQDEAIANARLIAAAPYLLAALKQLQSMGLGKEAYAICRAAIAKATGSAA